MGERPVALTIAGSDPSGGAGIQADLATFAAFGVHGAATIAALTVQDTRGVRAVTAVSSATVSQQLDAVLADLPVVAVKTGMLHRAAVVHAVAERLRAGPPRALVVDPVLRSTSGAVLLDAAGVEALRAHLLPLATVVTPNLAEASALTGMRVETPADMAAAARALVVLGVRAALVTGGHLSGDAVDVLCDGRDARELVAQRIPGDPVHGTGCALSAAITAALARGADLPHAVAAAKSYVTRAIAGAYRLGGGAAVLDLGVSPDP